MDQLQENSLETSRRLGSGGMLKQMLEDFPVLFDVKSLEITQINFYLKELFTGYGTRESRSEQMRRQLAEIKRKKATGQLSEHVFIQKLDMGHRLRAPAESPEGVSLYFLASTMVSLKSARYI